MRTATTPVEKPAAPLLVSVADAARLLGVSRTAIRSLLGCGLTERRIGARRLVLLTSIHRFVEHGGGDDSES
jgi:hypothetical protein